MDKKRRLAVLLGIICCYFIFGYFDSARGATLSQVMADNSLDYSMGGVLALLYYFGYFISTILGGIVSDKVPKKLLLVFGCAVLTLAVFGHMGATQILFVAVFLVGVSLGIYEVAGNSAVVEIYPPEQRGRYLNIVAGAYSIGAVLAPFIYSTAIKTSGNWKTAFYVIVPVIIISAITLMLSKYPKETFSVPSSFNLFSMKEALFAKNLRRYYIMIFLYLGAEATVISWMVSFMVEERGIDLNMASVSLSIYFLLVGFGRFLGGAILGDISIRKIVTICSSLAAICIAIGVFVPFLPWAIPAAGLFMSVICPMLVTATSNSCENNVGTTIGIFFAFAAAGAMTFSWISGQVNQLLSIRWGLLVAAILFVITAALALTHRNSKSDC